MPNRYGKLVESIKKYNPTCDFTLIEKAYKLSEEAHQGQHRISGEPFIIHPMEVAIILADLELDCTSIVAGILHDTIEDTTCTFEHLRDNFSPEIASLVEGITKLGKIPYITKEEQQAENLRKMFFAMAKDIRVILIKLADRLHNMRTLKYMAKDKQLEKAKETLEIYAPLAHRLGISKIKWELEDLCLRYIDPESYYELVDKIAIKRKERETYITKIIETLRQKTEELSIEANIEGRPKHFYSIYRKMKYQNKTLEQIFDLFALRVIVQTVQDCYAVLGLVHEIYKPVPGRFKDYIAMPKPNLYQSLHTTLIGPGGLPVEIQIRTWEMHRVSEVGIAAHWKYKEGTEGKADVDAKLAWLRQLLDGQKDMANASEFIENLKIDLFSDEVFVFTPKGDVLSLPAGSTPIDFAYAIHSEVGNKMMGAKVDSKIVPLDYVLRNGDIVEVLTSAGVRGPSLGWLQIAKSSQAKGKINQWFRKQQKEEHIAKGKDLIEKELRKSSYMFNQLFKFEWLENIFKKYNIRSVEDMYSLIGYGALTANKVISKLKEEHRKANKSQEPIEEEVVENAKSKIPNKKLSAEKSGVVVTGVHNCLIRFSRCCNAVPGDEIIGYITRGRGVSIHRKDCVNVAANSEEGRLIDVSWHTAGNTAYLAEITIMANDRTALLVEITNVFVQAKIPLKAVNARTTKEHVAIINLTLEITDTEQLEKIIKKLRKIDSVIEVKRNKQ